MPLVSKTFSQIITFTRASSATYFDAAGVLQTATTDVPRFDYDPSTLAARGILIEESRTNSIRNNTMQGAATGTPGTLPTNWAWGTAGAATYQVVATGTESGIAYVDLRIQGASAADSWNLLYEPANLVAAANGQTWTGSVYIKLIAGSVTNIPFIQRIVFRDSGGANIQALDSSAITPTNAGLATQRSTLSLTATQATTAFITLALNSGTPTGAFDITLRIGLPQLELGAFATSVIPTTTTAVTRAADVASVNTLSPWFNAVEGTLYTEATAYGLKAAGAQYEATIGTLPQNEIRNRFVNANVAAQIHETIAGETFAYTAAASANTVYKTALAYKTNDSQAAINGVVSATDTSVTLPTGMTVMYLGTNTSSGQQLCGYLRRITYYPRRLTSAELQTLTT